MIRSLIAFGLLMTPLPRMASVTAADADTPFADTCCCCPADVCQCGCEAPRSRSESNDDGEPAGPRFCGCDATPLAMPPAVTSTAERPEASGLVAVFDEVSDCAAITRSYFAHLPLGPPPNVLQIATVILLN